MVIYIFLLPAVESPDWCNRYVKETLGGLSRTDFFMDCTGAGYPYSMLPTMSPFFTCWIEIVCVIYFFCNKLYKRWWKETTKVDKRRNIVMLVVFTISVISLIVSIITLTQPYVSSFLRPIILATGMASIRHNCYTLWLDIKDSSVILLSIFLFVLAYAMVGYFVF